MIQHTSTHPHIHTSTHPHIHTSTHPHIHTSTHPHIHTSTHTIPPSIITLTHSLAHFVRSFVHSLLRRSSLTADPWVIFVGGLPPYWSIERSFRRWGAEPPLLVYRTKFPSLGGGTPPTGLSNEVSVVGGRNPPYWYIERSFRRWGAEPPYWSIEHRYRRWGAEPPDFTCSNSVVLYIPRAIIQHNKPKPAYHSA